MPGRHRTTWQGRWRHSKMTGVWQTKRAMLGARRKLLARHFQGKAYAYFFIAKTRYRCAANLGPGRRIAIPRRQGTRNGRHKRIRQDRQTGDPDGDELIFPKTFHKANYNVRQ